MGSLSAAPGQAPPAVQAAPPVVAAALASPSHPVTPAGVAALGPALRPLLRTLAPSRVAPAAVPGALRIGDSADRAETDAARVADTATSGPADAEPLTAAEHARLAAVRVHTGDVAERSAAAIGADAYALAGHVVLGRPRPGAGPVAQRQLLAHELAHALSEPPGAGVLRRQHAPAPPPPLRYDTDAQIFHPATLSTPDLQAALAAKQASGDLGPSFHIVGPAPGSEAERFLLNVLLQRAARANWGTELDAVTQIGPVPPAPVAQGAGAQPPAAGPAAQAPRGLVTVSIDAAGNATVTLISPTVPAASTRFATDAAARAALVADFGLSAVTDGSAPWTLPELIKVYEALLRLPAADRTALSGVELVREAALFDDAGHPLSGEFHHNQTVGGTTVTDVRQLRIASSAFAHDTVSFIGGAAVNAPMSFETVLHEAGHAVELKAQLDARRAEFNATANLNRAADAESVAATAFGAAATATNSAVTTVNAESRSATALLGTYSHAERTAASPYFNALQHATSAINTFANIGGSDPHPASEAAAQRAITARDTARGALPGGHRAVRDFAALSSAQDAWFAAAQQRAVAQARHAGTRAAVTTNRATVAAAHRATTATAAAAPHAGRTRRLQAFVDFVTAHHIPPLTQYAADNWPAKPEEFFAEAFSLWLNDPDYLGTQAPTLKAWFDAGRYRL